MSTLRCPDCGMEFSDTEAQCPECGCPATSATPVTDNASHQYLCPECGYPVPEGCTSCPECGAPVESNYVCEACGSNVPPGATVCPNCGCPVDAARLAMQNEQANQEPAANFSEKNESAGQGDETNDGERKSSNIGYFIAIIVLLLIGLAIALFSIIGKRGSDNYGITDTTSIYSSELQGTYYPDSAEADTEETDGAAANTTSEYAVWTDSTAGPASTYDEPAYGFQSSSDVFDFLSGEEFYADGVTLKVSRSGVYGNGNKIGSRPRVRSISPNSAEIVAGRIHLRVDRENETLTDLNDYTVYHKYGPSYE